MARFICLICANHVARRSTRCEHSDADLRRTPPVRSQAQEDEGKEDEGKGDAGGGHDAPGWWRPRNVFAVGLGLELLGALVAILTREREAGTVYVMVYGSLLIAGLVVVKVARFKDAWEEGWEEVLWILYRPFGRWHDDPYDAWYVCLAGLLVGGVVCVGGIGGVMR